MALSLGKPEGTERPLSLGRVWLQTAQPEGVLGKKIRNGLTEVKVASSIFLMGHRLKIIILNYFS